MSAFSDYLEPLLGYHALGKTAYAGATTLTVKLYTTAPTDAVGGTEVTGGGYVAVALDNNTTNFPRCATSGTPTKLNGTLIQFPTASAAWGTVTHWAIWDGANMLVWGPMSPNTYVALGDSPKIAIGALQITFTNGSTGGFTEAIRRNLLDLAFGKVSYTMPTSVYAGAGTALAGETLTEWADANYTRKVVTFATATDGVIPSNLAADLSVNVATAGVTLTHFGIWDDSASGNLVAVGPLTTSRVPAAADTVQFASGGIVVTVQ